MTARLFFTFFLLGPSISFAQKAPRLYTGASATLFSDAPFNSHAQARVGPALTVGVQLTPHWAVEAGVQAIWFKQLGYTPIITNSGYIGYDTTALHVTSSLVPLLARYTLTSSSAPLHIDLLGGVAWQRTSGQGPLYIAPDGSASRQAINVLYAVLGPQLRYALSTHFDLKLNLPVGARVAGNNDAALRNRLSISPQLGIQYVFAK